MATDRGVAATVEDGATVRTGDDHSTAVDGEEATDHMAVTDLGVVMVATTDKSFIRTDRLPFRPKTSSSLPCSRVLS